ncbi:MAG: aminoacyltransferase [Okeania sp. SIO3H1]|nr:aminoacyltransferase [Okeania sp. SIO3H1]
MRNLEAQITTMVSREAYETLQRQSEEQQNKLQNFEEHTDLMVSKENYEALQHHLKEQLNKLQYLESIVGSMVSQETYEALEKQSEFQKEIIADYQNKLTKLQQESHEQVETIQASRKQISELQTTSMIAENYILNRWQNRTFSR